MSWFWLFLYPLVGLCFVPAVGWVGRNKPPRTRVVAMMVTVFIWPYAAILLLGGVGKDKDVDW